MIKCARSRIHAARITDKVNLITKLSIAFQARVDSRPLETRDIFVPDAEATAILPTYCVSPRKLCWTRNGESTNRNASRIIGRCNGLQVRENVTAASCNGISAAIQGRIAFA